MKQIIRSSSLAALFIHYAVAVSSANPPAAAQAIVNAYEAEEAEVIATEAAGAATVAIVAIATAVVESGATTTIFTSPKEALTESYVAGRFG